MRHSKFFTQSLLTWHKSVDRYMPWKETKNPYHIWVSEVILQQTRVNQGTTYYLKFIQRFPSLKTLAESREEDVLIAWEGLGYYSRARNMHIAAQDIMKNFEGNFPDKYEDILSLKGIGPYTAAAIASFAFDQLYAVLDGNVMRVLSRYYGVSTAIDTSKGKKELNQLASQLIDKNRPGDYNQAIMDFGALQCTPRNPGCSICILSLNCVAIKKGVVNILPVKTKKVIVKKRYLNYFICRKSEEIYIQQRVNNDIWAKLHEFPMIESKKQFGAKKMAIEIKLTHENDLILLDTTEHKLTHQLLHLTFFRIRDIPQNDQFKNARLEKVKELHNFAFPKPLKNLIINKII